MNITYEISAFCSIYHKSDKVAKLLIEDAALTIRIRNRHETLLSV